LEIFLKLGPVFEKHIPQNFEEKIPQNFEEKIPQNFEEKIPPNFEEKNGLESFAEKNWSKF